VYVNVCELMYMVKWYIQSNVSGNLNNILARVLLNFHRNAKRLLKATYGTSGWPFGEYI